MKKVSFDFDGTLEKKHVQDFVRELKMLKDVDIWLVTSRNENYRKSCKMLDGKSFVLYEDNFSGNIDLWEVVEDLGIKEENVVFTNMTGKFEFFKKNPGFKWHLDDDFVELREIIRFSKTNAINVDCSSWKIKCMRLLNRP